MSKQQNVAHGSRSPSTSRRAAIATMAAISASFPMPVGAADADTISGLIRHAAEKNEALIRGDAARWWQIIRLAPDFTLMQPLGGPASHGFDASPKRLAALAQYFRNGEAALEPVQTYASDGLVVLVMIERQRGEVGGLPLQDWSLRVTEVYRKDGSEWQLVHRHADPLVHRVSLRQAAALARGLSEDE